MKILVTGAAGFIGAAVSQKLLKRGDEVIGFDNLNDYYDPRLKEARLKINHACGDFTDIRGDLADEKAVTAVFKRHEPQRVINLAAQAGVRYSMENPRAYIDSNIVGFLNVLEACRHFRTEHLVYASTSAVYGANTKLPFSTHQNVDHPLSLYGATKKANELMAHSYSHLYGLPTTGLRFFTVYGPWGRPDMALFIFTKNILAGKPVPIFNNGKHSRDFTYIDDIVEGVVRAVDRIPQPDEQWSGKHPDPATSLAPYRVYNIGNNKPVELMKFVELLEKHLGRKAIRKYLPMQPGDVPSTWADVDALEAQMGYRPVTSIDVGVGNFVNWYKEYYAHEAIANAS